MISGFSVNPTKALNIHCRIKFDCDFNVGRQYI